MTVYRRIEEHVVKGKPLGRHVNHDPRSRAFAVAEYPESLLKAVRWTRFGSVLNQGELGSCTGNAAAGAINTTPIYGAALAAGVLKVPLTERSAVVLYKRATVLDPYDGTYPPDDTGSDGLSVMKAAKEKGYISGYTHAFSILGALSALMHSAVITGLVWLEGFDDPDPVTGLVKPTGQVRGGHEFEVIGYEPGATFGTGIVEAVNSWGTSWGLKGRFRFTVATWKKLLAQQGDVTAPRPVL